MWLLNRGSEVCRKVNGIRVGVLRRRWGYEKMSEEEVGVMRNAMTTRAPCGAKKIPPTTTGTKDVEYKYTANKRFFDDLKW